MGYSYFTPPAPQQQMVDIGNFLEPLMLAQKNRKDAEESKLRNALLRGQVEGLPVENALKEQQLTAGSIENRTKLIDFAIRTMPDDAVGIREWAKFNTENGVFNQMPSLYGTPVVNLPDEQMGEFRNKWLRKALPAAEQMKMNEPNYGLTGEAANLATIKGRKPTEDEINESKPYQPMTREQQMADFREKERIKTQTGTTDVPAEIQKFEIVTFGRPVPEKRGTPEYKDARLTFLKQDRDATTAPSKTEPKILRQEFITGSKDFVSVRDSYNRIKASAKNPSPAGDLALIFNYMKMLDPGSVVRESEFATAAATGAYGERIKAAVSRVVTGERLSDEMRNDFISRSDMLYEEQRESHQKLKTEYDRLAKELGVEPSHVIIDYLTEQNKIGNGQYDVGSVYEDAGGKKARYKGKDATGKDMWESL